MAIRIEYLTHTHTHTLTAPPLLLCLLTRFSTSCNCADRSVSRTEFSAICASRESCSRFSTTELVIALDRSRMASANCDHEKTCIVRGLQSGHHGGPCRSQYKAVYIYSATIAYRLLRLANDHVPLEGTRAAAAAEGSYGKRGLQLSSIGVQAAQLLVQLTNSGGDCAHDTTRCSWAVST